MYIDSYLNYYLSNDQTDFMKKHIQNKLCKKIDGYRGFKAWFKRGEGRAQRRHRKQIYKIECN